jgi:1-deoxy-D-xylulose-5-phosphate reductoisomerase
VRTVALLGSTGSIGTQAIDVISRNPGAFNVIAIAAGGANPALVVEQVSLLRPALVAIAHPAAADAVRTALADAGLATEVVPGIEGVVRAAACGADVVLNGVTGSIGLRPTLAALASGSTLALANKESLVAGGALVNAALQRPDQIVPVDSEHSALAQALRGGRPSELRRLVLTASGGAFRGRTRAQLEHVTVSEALHHPNWDMGPVVTINSASLMNKALEVIEAHHLFGVPMQQIDVVIHAQSIVHSMVEFHDGSTLAQVSPPDMRLPIALGLSWPERIPHAAPGMDWSVAQSWTFEPLDEAAFPAVALARQAVAESDLHPAVLNAANEECVAAFTAGKLSFLGIVETVRDVVESYEAPGELSLEAVDQAERWAREQAAAVITSRQT